MALRRVTATIYPAGKATEVTGTFHAWSMDFEQFEEGIGTFAVAIVELPDGTIVTPAAGKVRFLEPLEEVA